MSSGVMVNAECQTAFQQLSEAKKYRYIIYKIVENEVVVEVAVTAEEVLFDLLGIFWWKMSKFVDCLRFLCF